MLEHGRNSSQMERFINRSGGTIPAHGVCAILSIETINNEKILSVTKPSSTCSTYVINGPNEVKNGLLGRFYAGPLAIARYSGDYIP